MEDSSTVRVRSPAPMYDKRHRKEAEMIKKFVDNGKIESKDFPGLIKEGLDPLAVACYLGYKIEDLF